MAVSTRAAYLTMALQDSGLLSPEDASRHPFFPPEANADEAPTVPVPGLVSTVPLPKIPARVPAPMPVPLPINPAPTYVPDEFR